MLCSRSALAAVCALASVSSAAIIINPVTNFDPVGPGLTENPHVAGTGLVMFDDLTFQSTATFVLLRLKANTTYGVKIDSTGAGQANVNAFTAQTFLGIGIYATNFPGDATFGTVVDVFRWDGNANPFAVFEVTPGEERARGFGSNVN